MRRIIFSHSWNDNLINHLPGVTAGEANAVDVEDAVVEHASLNTSDSVDILGALESLFLTPEGTFFLLLRDLAESLIVKITNVFWVKYILIG